MKVNFLNFSDSSKERFFLLTGGEFILKQDAAMKILQTLGNEGFNEKVSIHQDELDQVEDIILRNIGGSLFQENLILHIRHTSGKFPEKIKSLLEKNLIFEASNLALIVESSIEKLPISGGWMKNFDQHGVIVDCKKLQPLEEKLWLKRQLDFLPKDLLPLFGGSIFQNNEGNLVGQKNESQLLKLLFTKEENLEDTGTEHIIFHSGLSAFELEDVLIKRNFQKALVTIAFLREHDQQNSAPLIWIIAKIINACLISIQSTNKKSALIKSGVWSSKTSQYLRLIKNAKTSDFLQLNKEVLRLDLMNKGILKSNVWEQIEKIILKLQVVTALKN